MDGRPNRRNKTAFSNFSAVVSDGALDPVLNCQTTQLFLAKLIILICDR